MELLGAPSLYANIPILNIKNDIKAEKIKDGTLIYENGGLGKNNTENVKDLEENVAKIKENSEINENNNFEIPSVIELGESTINIDLDSSEKNNTVNNTSEEINSVEDNMDKVNIELNLENKEAAEIQVEDSKNYEENISDLSEDDDDDDVTFDDLLKKAEEEEAHQEEIVNEKKIESSKNKINQKPIRSRKNSRQNKT